MESFRSSHRGRVEPHREHETEVLLALSPLPSSCGLGVGGLGTTSSYGAAGDKLDHILEIP